MVPGNVPLTLVKGSMFRLTITIASTDVTGWTGRMQVRVAAGADLQCDGYSGATGPLLGVCRVLDGPAGKLEFYFPSTAMQNLIVGNAVHDIVLTPSTGIADSQQWFNGKVKVLPEIIA